MKVLVVLSVVVAFAAADKLTPGELQMLEAFDYDSLLANDEQRKILFDCLLDKGDCGAYKQLADLSKQIMFNKCAECSPTQRTKYDRLLKVVHDKFEPFYNELLKKIADYNS